MRSNVQQLADMRRAEIIAELSAPEGRGEVSSVEIDAIIRNELLADIAIELSTIRQVLENR